jgi:hypothetical protein
MVATQHDNNMVAAQNRVQTVLGTDNSTKGKKVETTIHHTKQPQLLVRVSMIESLNEEIEIKLSSFVQCLFQSQRTEKRSDPGMCVLWGHLT